MTIPYRPAAGRDWLGGDPSGPARRELWAWAALAVLALALAGAIALLLALSRVPGIQDWVSWPVDFFRKGLVVHVTFSFAAWFMGLFGALLHLAAQRAGAGAPRLALAGPAAAGLVAASYVLLFVPALLDRGEASLNNYVPVIIDPLFYGGLMVLAGGVVLAALRLLANLAGRKDAALDPVTWTLGAGVAAFAIALGSILGAWSQLSGEPLSPGSNEYLFWGGGHALQFVNMTLVLACWVLLGRAALGEETAPAFLIRFAAAMLLLYITPAIGFQVKYEVTSDRLRDLMTALQYGLGPPAVLFLAGAAYTVWLKRGEGWRHAWSDPAYLAFVLSGAVFLLGAFLGLFVDGGDTRTPGHYHGVIGGITLAGMGLFHAVLLPLLGRPIADGRLVRVQIWTYAAGQALACLGLFWAGGHGTPRKTAGAAQGLDSFGEMAGMALNGIGALVAVVGGVLFVWIAGSALLRRKLPVD